MDVVIPSVEKVWVPRSLSTGCDGELSKIDRLVFLIIADRTGNQSAIFRFRPHAVAERAGVKSANTVKASLGRLQKLDLVNVEYEGRKTFVTRTPFRSSARLEVPLATLWATRSGEPRARSNAASAASALLGLLHFADWSSGHTFVSQDRLGKHVGCSERQIRRDMESLDESLPAGVLRRGRSRKDDGLLGGLEYTLSWEFLPPYVSVSEMGGEAGGDLLDFPSSPENGDVKVLVDLLRDRVLEVPGCDVETVNGSVGSWGRDVLGLMATGVSAAQIADIVLWATDDPFWQGKVVDMNVIRRNWETMTGRPEFKGYVDALNQAIHWPVEHAVV